MTNDCTDTVCIRKFIGYRFCLGRKTSIVSFFRPQLFAIDATGPVDICHSGFGAFPKLKSKRSVGTCMGSRYADDNLATSRQNLTCKR
jgi:hypothetical protein